MEKSFDYELLIKQKLEELLANGAACHWASLKERLDKLLPQKEEKDAGLILSTVGQQHQKS